MAEEVSWTFPPTVPKLIHPIWLDQAYPETLAAKTALAGKNKQKTRLRKNAKIAGIFLV